MSGNMSLDWNFCKIVFFATIESFFILLNYTINTLNKNYSDTEITAQQKVYLIWNLDELGLNWYFNRSVGIIQDNIMSFLCMCFMAL